jgi:hypothetical protein
MLLGWIAGGLIVTDPIAEQWVENLPLAQYAEKIAGLVGAVVVWIAAKLIYRRTPVSAT